MMNTVANNIQLCITSQSRKMNSLAFMLECLFCCCVAYNFIKTGKCRSRGCIPQKNFCCIPPNSSLRYGVLQCSKLQRWSPRGRPWSRGRPRGHILKSLALASKVKSLALASRPQVLENWPVLGSRTARFFVMLKLCGALEKFFGKRFLVEIA